MICSEILPGQVTFLSSLQHPPPWNMIVTSTPKVRIMNVFGYLHCRALHPCPQNKDIPQTWIGAVWNRIYTWALASLSCTVTHLLFSCLGRGRLWFPLPTASLRNGQWVLGSYKPHKSNILICCYFRYKQKKKGCEWNDKLIPFGSQQEWCQGQRLGTGNNSKPLNNRDWCWD